MASVFLLIPDVALREAVLEQIDAAKRDEARPVETAQAFVRQAAAQAAPGAPGVLIIDEAAYDKKAAALLRGLDDAMGKPVILLLGGEDDGEGTVSETFAKPLRLGHLLSRLRYYTETALLLREHVVRFGAYRLEPQKRRILGDREGDPIRLTEKETALLVFLAQSKEPVTRRDILAAVWGYDERIDTHTLETHIYQLRRKLDAGGEAWLVSEAGTYHLARGRES